MVYTKELVETDGLIWECEPTTTASGLMTVIVNKKHRKNGALRPRFTAVSFNSKGDEIGAVDERGNIYIFHVVVNKYQLIHKAHAKGMFSCIAYSPRSSDELSVSLSSYDGSVVLCMNSDSTDTFATLKAHRTPVLAIRFHKTSALMATASRDKVVLWNTNDWTKKKSLRNVMKAGSIVDVAFTPVNDMLLVAFKSGKILGYGAHTYELQFNLESPLPPDPDPVTNRGVHRSSLHQISVRTVEVSSNARFLFVGCDGGVFMIWDLLDQMLIRMVQMPESVGNIVKGKFLIGVTGLADPTLTHVIQLAVLGGDGVIRFISVNREEVNDDGCRVVHVVEPSGNTAIIDFNIDGDEQFLVASVSDGTLSLHNLTKGVEYFQRMLESPSAEFSSMYQAAHMLIKSFPGFVTPEMPRAEMNDFEQDQKELDNAEKNMKNMKTEVESQRSAGTSEFNATKRIPVEEDSEYSVRNSNVRVEQRRGDQDEHNSGMHNENLEHNSEIHDKHLEQSPRMHDEHLDQNSNMHHNQAGQHNATEDSYGIPGRRTHRSGKPRSSQSTETDMKRGEKMPSISALLRGTTSEEILLDRERIRGIVDEYGSFPERYRFLIWRFLLQLPENEVAYNSLRAKGVHPVWEDLESKYPMKDRRMASKLVTTLSALSYYSPVFSEVSYLPAIAMPFVSCFRSNSLVAFEMLLTVILNWCSNWFESFPHPPIPLLSGIEAALAHADPELHQHLVKYEISSQVYAWVLLRSLFTEVLEKEEWLRFWDNLIARQNKPHLLSVSVVAYLCYFRSSLFLLRRAADFQHFFRYQNALNVSRFTKFVLRIERTLPPPLVHRLTGACAPAPRGTALPVRGPYPALVKYPKFVVDFRAQERLRVEAEEKELLRRQQLVASIEQQTQQLEAEEREWRLYQEKLLHEEEQRSREEVLAFERRHEEKMALLARQRTQKLEQVAKLEVAAKERLALQKRMREAEARRLEQELERQNKQHKLQLETQSEDEALKKLEFEAAHRVMDMQMQRSYEADLQGMRQGVLARLKKLELERKLQEESWAQEDEERTAGLQLRREQAEKEARMKEFVATNRELETKTMLSELELETEKQRLVRERALRKLQEATQAKMEESIKTNQVYTKLLADEEVREKETLVRDQVKWLNQERLKREAVLKQEIEQSKLESEATRIRIEELESKKRQRDFEARVLVQQEEELQRQLAEEKELQQKLQEIEQQRLADRAAEDKLLKKMEETEFKTGLSNSLRHQTSEKVEEERLNYLAQRQAEHDAMRLKYNSKLSQLSRDRHLASVIVSPAKHQASDDEDSQDSPSNLAMKARELLERHKQKRREMSQLIGEVLDDSDLSE